MTERPLKDRVKDVIGQYGPAVVALAQLAVEIWSDVARHGPAGL
jgi:hypothetical protein